MNLDVTADTKRQPSLPPEATWLSASTIPDVEEKPAVTVKLIRPLPRGEVSGMVFLPALTTTNSLPPGVTTAMSPGAETSPWQTFGELITLVASSHGIIPDNGVRALYRQLEAIFEPDDEYFEPQIASFYGLLSLIGGRPDWRHPSVGLRDDGIFSASWSPARGAKLTLYFDNEREVSWFAADTREWPPTTPSGTGTLAEVTRQIDEDLAAWVRREG